MSLRRLFGALFVLLAVFTTGCCGHRHHCQPSNSCNSCYSSPASRTETPSFIQIPSPVPTPQR